jgi:DUF4097 and DUF4098 domain-containing protein YvlB
MQPWIRSFALISALGLCVSTSWGAGKTFDRQFTAPPGGQLVVDTADSTITVIGHDSRDLTVHADIRGTEAFEITAEQTGAGVTVRGRPHLRWHSVLFSYSNVHIWIEVPRDYPVELKSSDGNLEVSQLDAGVHGSTSDGRIEVHDISGAVDMRSSDGSIKAQNIKGSTRLRTSDGSISVSHVAGELDVQTSDGNLTLEEVDGKITAASTDGHVRVQVRSNHGITVSAGDGNVTLQLPGDVQGTLSAEARDGHVHSDLPVTMTATESRGPDYLSGQINGGGETISLHASDGNISIQKL